MTTTSEWKPSDFRDKRPSHVYTVGFIFQMENYGPFEKQWLLLTLKDRPDWQKEKYNGPGGKVEDGEWPHDTIKRELFEETGIRLEAGRLFCILHCSTPSDSYSVVYFYWAFAPFKVLGEAQARTYGTREPCRLFRVEDVLQDSAPIIPNLRWLIQMARNNMVGAEWARFFEVYERYEYDDPMDDVDFDFPALIRKYAKELEERIGP